MKITAIDVLGAVPGLGLFIGAGQRISGRADEALATQQFMASVFAMVATLIIPFCISSTVDEVFIGCAISCYGTAILHGALGAILYCTKRPSEQ